MLRQTLASFELEHGASAPVIGIDEAGRGPWAGPVVVAGVKFFRYDNLPEWVELLNDSKKLSAKKRALLYNYILQSQDVLSFFISTVDVETIDRVNILEATLQGMRECIYALRKDEDVVLVDGTNLPIKERWCTSVVKGDSISYSIAAASILAKVYRDQYMQRIALDFPEYGWEKNAGYGTALHSNALKQHGITPHHRKSFAPIRLLSV